MYKYKATVERIREVLLPYEPCLEAMCDLATGLLKELVPGIEIIAGEVFDNERGGDYTHIWAYDTKEKYFIDITSEQFGLPPCLCSQDISEFEKNKYKITCDFHQWNGAFEKLAALKVGPVLNCGKLITFDDLLSQIKPKEPVKKKTKGWFFGGTRRKR